MQIKSKYLKKKKTIGIFNFNYTYMNTLYFQVKLD